MMEPLSCLSSLFSDRPLTTQVAWRGEHCLTLGDLRRDVAAVVQQLQTHTLQRWALCYQDCYHFLVALLACGHTGCAVVLPGHHRTAQLAELANAIDGVLTDLPLALPSSVNWPLLFTPDLLGSDSDLPDWPRELSCTLFTSGSTGQPKAIVKSQAQLEAELAAQWTLWHPHWGAALVLATVSHQHIYGLLFRALLPVCAGIPFVAETLEYQEQIAWWVERHPGQSWVLISSPAFLSRLDCSLAVDGCSALYSSGGPLPHAAAVLSQQLYGQWPIEIYGSSETGGIAWRQAILACTSWQPLPGLTVSQDELGCLCLRSPFLPDDQEWRTEDRIAFNDAGFTLLGRQDRIVKLAEKRISLDEVERRLQQLAWVQEAVVLPLEQEARQVLGAVLILSAEGMRQWQALGAGRFLLAIRQGVRPWLEPVALPRRLRCLDAIPLNSQGKRPYAQLKELFDVPS
jgi:acyl-coenzyme A synthetase/AMP-(fatty) acid ligase